MCPPEKKYVLWFAQEHVDFRQAEIDSLLQLWNIQMTTQVGHKPENPFWIVGLPNDEAARKLASRSMSLRCIFELWSHANQIGTFHERLEQYIQSNRTALDPLFGADRSFKVTIETYNKHFSQAEKVAKIETLQYLPNKGPVNLKTPDVHFWYIEFWGLDPMDVPEEPLDVLFGCWVADARRDMINEISLKRRKFIGNTSMDPQLSLLMANQGLAKAGDLVFDPFVGSGSLLVAAAKFGAYVLGGDIDYMTLHGKSKPTRVNQKVREADESIYANLKQYGCEGCYVDVLISDFSRSIWNESIQFDSVITDPPYGIREATERIEFKTQKRATCLNENAIHYPSTSPYQFDMLYRDLLNFSARYLKMGGRLVCWFPILRKDATPDMLPRHKCLELVANSEQPLSVYSARRLLTYEKVSDLEEDMDSYELSPVMVENFRQRYMNTVLKNSGTRKERRSALRDVGREEAIKRGKQQDIDGKWKYIKAGDNEHSKQ
ncbi:tRNA (guanine(10)-N2)-methyltransferase homolog [Toxorhynchites rutilus septentrionalis]|uniref:tRNA (guanine(10)-N2)-methyltransferase homolog n=1 Tax=Toxorhynchites rutilus septentrionalis TaxID=329112 RepID=UPI0024797268|nr:tRNA (guanine(10)-N2)-methyltransferase homolog [Toxorhynchites rutilus septentrionalis]